ncbi:MAG: hypothetical protein KF690_04705 [Bacteroidetes bacterium]|nr:hypothetical protein [Bacteroidota bacterium]
MGKPKSAFTNKQLVAVLALAILAITAFFFLPLFQGKRIIQYDHTLILGVQKNIHEYNAAHPDSAAQWSMSSFSGMPAAGIYRKVEYSHLIKSITDVVFRVIPQPVWYHALGMLGMFVLVLGFAVNAWAAAGIAVGYGFFAYYIHIVEAGHDQKFNTLMLLPALLLGIQVLMKGRLYAGILIIFLFTAWAVYAGHVQMLYYFLLPAIAFGIYYITRLVRDKQFVPLAIRTGLLVLGVGLGLLLNYERLVGLNEYGKVSTRSHSELSPETEARINPNAAQNTTVTKSTALDREYAYGWSHGRQELLSLVIPNAQGGASQGRAPKGGKLLELYGNNPTLQGKAWPLYWGPQSFTSGPYYLGAVLFFLCLLGLFLNNSVLKWGMLYAGLLLVILSLGRYSLSIPQSLVLLLLPVVYILTHKYIRNIPKPAYGLILAVGGYLLVQMLPDGGFPDGAQTMADWCMDNLPLYDHFRVPASMLAVLPLCVAILAMLGIRGLMDAQVSKAVKLRALYVAAGIPVFIALVLALAPGLVFDSFAGPGDARIAAGMGQNAKAFLDALEADRRTLLSIDAWRSAGFIVLAAGMLFLWVTGRIRQTAIALGAVSCLVLLDIFVVDMRYLWRDGYEAKTENNIAPMEADLILNPRLKKEYFRVFPVSRQRNPFNDGVTPTSLYTIGGYSPIKLKRYQQLIDAHLSKFNWNVINMLNTGYIIHNPGLRDSSLVPVLPRPTQQNEMIYLNRNNYGPAWITPEVKVMPRPDEVILALDSVNSRFTALIEARDKDKLGKFDTGPLDTTEYVRIASWNNNHMIYRFKSSKPRFVTFSEVYYKEWKAYLDKIDPAHEIPILHTNYVLRGSVIPAGEHTIIFECADPRHQKLGMVSTVLSILFLLAAAGYGVWVFLQRRKKQAGGHASDTSSGA